MDKHEWPTFQLPDALITDQGKEYAKSDNSVENLGIRVNTTRPQRPDWKSAIERFFSRYNANFSNDLPGTVKEKP